MSGSRGSKAFRARYFVATAVVLATAWIGHAAWDGNQSIVLRDSFSARFATDDAATHRFPLFIPTGATLKAKLTIDDDADLVPDWIVVDSDGDEVDFGGKKTGTKIKNFKFEDGGAHVFVVTAESGAGRYKINLSGSKFPKKFTQKKVEGPLLFESVRGAKMTAKVNNGATITGLQGPFGSVDIGGGPVTRIKNLVLPWDGEYALLYDGTPNKAEVCLKNPRKTAWVLDRAQESRGHADEARDKWLGSGHADLTAEAFRHWDEDGEISESCAACHSTFGFQDFVGADGTPSNVLGSPANRTDNPADIGSTVNCNACHNTEAEQLDVVQFPSGEIVDDLGPEARCMQCHQGRESKVSVDEEIEGSGVENDDEISSALSFQNIHYFAAGASLYGHEALGAYEFDDNIYNRRFLHVSTINDCQECHDQHSLELRFDACSACHTGTTDNESTWNIREVGSVPDYDADGDAEEGIYFEMKTMAEKAYQGLQDYADALGVPIVYSSAAYPYYFNDLNGNGEPDPEEINFGNRYTSFTARSLRAAYNYQYWQKDPGLHAHNAKYAIEFLYDTIATLDEHESVTVPGFEEMVRNDSGHFDNTSRAFRNWDSRDEVSAGCARCHSPGGFEFYADFGIDPTVGYPPSDGLECEQCHPADSFTDAFPARRYIDQVTFPSDVTIENDPENPDDSFLCMTCHQGRSAKKDIDESIENGDYSFSKIHYLAAGPSLYGADAEVGYEYDENSFVGEQDYEPKWNHVGGSTAECSFCHLDDHTFLPKLTANCTSCHPEADGNLKGVRRDREIDYNGNGDNLEFLELELSTFAERLLAAMDEYSETVIGTDNGLVHSSSYPYFFFDLNGNGIADGEEIAFANGYDAYDGPLLKAAFNYEFWANEPGAWAHNTHYMLQLLFDSIDDLQLSAIDNGTPLGSDRLTTPTPLTRPSSD